MTWDTLTNEMTVNVTFSGLTTATTAAHIHCCVAPPGNAGVATTTPTFPGFPLGVTAGTYSQTFDMTAPASYNPAFVTAQRRHDSKCRGGPPRRPPSRPGLPQHPHDDVPGRRNPRLPARTLIRPACLDGDRRFETRRPRLPAPARGRHRVGAEHVLEVAAVQISSQSRHSPRVRHRRTPTRSASSAPSGAELPVAVADQASARDTAPDAGGLFLGDYDGGHLVGGGVQGVLRRVAPARDRGPLRLVLQQRRLSLAKTGSWCRRRPDQDTALAAASASQLERARQDASAIMSSIAVSAPAWDRPPRRC